MSRDINTYTGLPYTELEKTQLNKLSIKPKSARKIGGSGRLQEQYDGCWVRHDKLRAQLHYIRHKLLNTKTDNRNSLDWSTPRQIRRSLCWLLYVRGMFISTGNLVLEISRNMSYLSTQVNVFSHSHHELKRSQRRDAKEVVSVAKKISTTLYTPEAYFSLKELHDDYNSLLKEADLLWASAQPILLTLPDYKQIKDKLPINGRAAYSMLKALATGQDSRCQPTYDIIFGFAHDSTSKSANVFDNIKKMCRALRRGIEHGGKAPSVSDGRLLLSTIHFTKHEKTQPYKEGPRASVVDRRSSICWKFDRRVKAHTFCGDFDSTRISMSFLKQIRFADKETLRDWHKYRRVAHKVMGINKPLDPDEYLSGDGFAVDNTGTNGRITNQTLTIITGPVEHLQGDDYYAPAMWVEVENRYSSSSHRRGSSTPVPRTVQGYVLLRRGWPDVVHTRKLHPAPEDEASTHPTYRLDQASSSYFVRLREEAERKLNQNQRVARMLKRVRKLFVPFTRQASYQSGNCVPGTEAFIASLRLVEVVPDVLQNKEAAVDPRDLARCWRKAKYIQTDRFMNVVRLLETNQASQIAAAMDIAKHFFPVEISDSWTSDMLQQFSKGANCYAATGYVPPPEVPIEHEWQMIYPEPPACPYPVPVNHAPAEPVEESHSYADLNSSAVSPVAVLTTGSN